MSIISCVICFVVVFLSGCVIGLVITVLLTEQGNGKYYEQYEIDLLNEENNRRGYETHRADQSADTVFRSLYGSGKSKDAAGCSKCDPGAAGEPAEVDPGR